MLDELQLGVPENKYQVKAGTAHQRAQEKVRGTFPSFLTKDQNEGDSLVIAPLRDNCL